MEEKNHDTTIVGPLNTPNDVDTTLPETNIAPEDGLLEDDISFWDGLFSREYASFRECILF